MDLSFRSAVALAAMTRRREIGCLELLDHYIARVEQLDGPINAVVCRDFGRARDNRSEGADNRHELRHDDRLAAVLFVECARRQQVRSFEEA